MKFRMQTVCRLVYSGGKLSMGKILVPGSNTKERALFTKLGIELITAIDEAAFCSLVADYLGSRNVLHLASYGGTEVRSTALEYFSDYLTVHIFSEGGGKIANIKKHPQVCYSIADPYNPADGILGTRGIQVWGTASVFKKNDDPEKAADIFNLYRQAHTIQEQGISDEVGLINFNIITIVPKKIRYLDLKKGFRNVVWKETD